MRTDVLAAMVAFCFVSGVTPGPNNLMLMTSGVNFGFRRTLPHLFGVVLGFCLMVALVERAEGRDEPDSPLIGRVALRDAAPRRRGKTIASRRARFLTRRKVGRPELCARVEANCELFGGSTPDR